MRIFRTLTVGALVLILCGTVFWLWFQNKELRAQPKLPSVVFNTISREQSFFNGNEGSDAGKLFENERTALIASGASFVAVDLHNLSISLYEDGRVIRALPVLSKGREGSWWETPTGRYSTLSKEGNHFSSIGKVWMPWSIQFYGNFFIHGWPYYDDGTPVAKEYSGGCVRLSSEDAKIVYEFVEKGMPILVFDDETVPVLYRALSENASEIPFPTLTAPIAFVADLNTGEIIANKNGDDVVPIASLTKLMTATVASELIYLERYVTITKSMLTASIQSVPLAVNEKYRAFDLLYPLLESSSNGSASAIAAMLGESYFVKEMNRKGDALGMKHAIFVDPSGIGDGNVASARDLTRLAKYMLDKRKFLFDISRGESFSGFTAQPPKGTVNLNEFASSKALLGMKNGETNAARKTILTVWNGTTSSGDKRAIAIVILGSDQRENDTRAVLDWLSSSFELQFTGT